MFSSSGVRLFSSSCLSNLHQCDDFLNFSCHFLGAVPLPPPLLYPRLYIMENKYSSLPLHSNDYFPRKRASWKNNRSCPFTKPGDERKRPCPATGVNVNSIRTIDQKTCARYKIHKKYHWTPSDLLTLNSTIYKIIDENRQVVGRHKHRFFFFFFFISIAS